MAAKTLSPGRCSGRCPTEQTMPEDSLGTLQLAKLRRVLQPEAPVSPVQGTLKRSPRILASAWIMLLSLDYESQCLPYAVKWKQKRLT